jgi:hypothetical protein
MDTGPYRKFTLRSPRHFKKSCCLFAWRNWILNQVIWIRSESSPGTLLVGRTLCAIQSSSGDFGVHGAESPFQATIVDQELVCVAV